MRVADLGAFLRSLAAPLQAIGAAAGGLSAVADALAPFEGMTMTELADYLARAEASGAAAGVPHTEPDGLAAVRAAAAELGGAARGNGTVDSEPLRAGLAKLGAAFGLTITLKEPTGWADGVQATARVRKVAAGVAGETDLASPAVASLAELGDTILKAVAGNLGVNSGRKKGVELARMLVAHVSGVADHSPPPKPAGKTTAPRPDPEVLAAELEAIARRSDADPFSVTAAEVDEAAKKVMALTAPQKKAVAKRVANVKVATADAAVDAIRNRLGGVRATVDAQRA